MEKLQPQATLPVTGKSRAMAKERKNRQMKRNQNSNNRERATMNTKETKRAVC